MRVGETTRIGPVTGEGSPGRTAERFGIHATDLGIPWDGGDGRVWLAFGDTYGRGWGGSGPGPGHADWRRNVLAYSTDRDLATGLRLDGVVAREDGTAAQVLPSGSGREITVIPNSGIAVAGMHYLHYMSVRAWLRPGRWRTNHAGIAVSRDGGWTWDKPRDARWSNRWGDSRFQLGAFAPADGHVYLLGTTNGRYGDAYLARAAPAALPATRAFEYWTGSGWSRRARAAAVVVDGPLGEMSLGFHRDLGRWLLMHLDETRRGIVLRSAPRLIGPWTVGEVVVSGDEYPAVYGGYLHPWSLTGPDLYYLVSQWGPYNVYLTRTRLLLD
ncbi:hypothetical protein SacglDRAFT_03625 [Saccharomonospora glauca K62]|uniref:DUF4185 domain-containing protein n=1 Tax=Saccharomonospora glauca K62 TaxID=928724 RepID=I1D6A6_9PSEU|nr:hypothetical protein SacglDRAFT_03625 [Saccharomonospora glauca K62]